METKLLFWKKISQVVQQTLPQPCIPTRIVRFQSTLLQKLICVESYTYSNVSSVYAYFFGMVIFNVLRHRLFFVFLPTFYFRLTVCSAAHCCCSQSKTRTTPSYVCVPKAVKAETLKGYNCSMKMSLWLVCIGDNKIKCGAGRTRRQLHLCSSISLHLPRPSALPQVSQSK